MVYSTINRIESEYSEKSDYSVLAGNETSFNTTSTLNENQSMELKIRIATGLAFWCGIFQVEFPFKLFANEKKKKIFKKILSRFCFLC